MTDKKLLEIYMIGFNDELDGLDKKDFNYDFIDCIFKSIDINDMVVISKDEYNKLK